jgi:maltose O-acetyltransferase
MIKQVVASILLKMRDEANINALCKMGLRIGSNCHIQQGVIIDYSHCWLIEIGNNVTIAPRAYILAHDASTKRHLGYTSIGKVKIGDNVFIGAGAIILPNVCIGSNAIVGAGSVVLKDVPANIVVAGNPARELYSVDTYIQDHKDGMKHYPLFGEEFTLRKNVSAVMKKIMSDKMIGGRGYIV